MSIASFFTTICLTTVVCSLDAYSSSPPVTIPPKLIKPMAIKPVIIKVIPNPLSGGGTCEYLIFSLIVAMAKIARIQPIPELIP